MREGKRLGQPIAEAIQRIIYAPRLASEREDCFMPLCAVNAAHLVMLAECGILAPAAAARLAAAMLEIRQGGPNSLDWNPAREDAYYNYEARLVELAGIEIGGQIHAGRSRNDIGPTIDRIRVRNECLRLSRQLGCFQEALLNAAALHARTVMSGYTHLQAAQPITYGFYLLGLAQALERDAERLTRACQSANLSPMGAAAFAGTSFPIDRQRTAALLGFDGLIEHAQDAVASRDFFLDAMTACVSIASTWSRFAQDLYVWSTREFGLIVLSDRIAGTSSIMPQKKNPVVLEHLKAKSAHVIGQLVAMLASVRATHFTMTIDGCRASTASAWPMFRDVDDSLTLARLVVEEAAPDAQRMLEAAADNFSTVTDLADALVTESGLSFRQAHHVVGAAVARLTERGASTRALDGRVLDAAALEVIGRKLNLSDAWISARLDPTRSVQARISQGASSPDDVERMILDSRQRLAKRLAQLDRSEENLLRAQADLDRAVEELAASDA
jgi:argininosuccinate lyase